jgi:aryl-alcohol dehydrogenase-like predicted oxidoreductase
MQYRRFGRLGWNVSSIGFGAWAIGAAHWGPQSHDDSINALHAALDAGVNFIDTAQGYGDGHSERVIAEALKTRRERVYVATKIPPAPGPWPPSPYCDIEDRYPERYLRERIERSLRDLKTDCIDVIQLHTWTRAWNRQPTALEHLAKFKREGKLLGIGISTPEHDQNSLIDLMRAGLLDCVQVIYNIFEQEPAAEFLPVAREHDVGVIVRVPFDEGSLTGKYKPDHVFPEGDFRRNYFAGDRLARSVARAEKVRATVASEEPDLPRAALRFCLAPEAVSTVIPGMRNVAQARANADASDAPPLSVEMMKKLRDHNWRRPFWYSGK